MSGEILEIERSALEELERIEQAVTDRIVHNPWILPDTLQLSTSSSLNGKRKRPVRETTLSQLEVAKFLERYQEQCKYMNSVISGVKRRRQKKGDEVDATDGGALVLADQHIKEVKALGEFSGASQQLLDQYSKEVSSIKEFYRKYPNQDVDDLAATYAMARTLKKRNLANNNNNGLDKDVEQTDQSVGLTDGGVLSTFAVAENVSVDTEFSGEEYYGRFVDMVGLHEQFLNLHFVQHQLSYTQYLDKMSDFSDKSIYSSQRLNSSHYFEYIVELHKYLETFFRKTRILAHPESSLASIESDFDSLWQSQKYPSWIREDKESRNGGQIKGEGEAGAGAGSTDGESGSSDPLFCVPCNKRFTNEALFNNHLPGRKHKRNAAAATAAAGTSSTDGSGANNSPSSNISANIPIGEDLKLRALASHEYHIYCLADLLAKVITDTKSNVERRQALTDRERQAEIEALELEANGNGYSDNSDAENDNNNNNDDDDSEDEVVYNPLKLPLGWDGRPIPFWLYKYQGLGIEFDCEVCGNASYAGRKAFDKHFLEPRHVHGLRCLGVQPGPLFKGITKLADVMSLWEKIKKDNRQLETTNEVAVEMEDDEGNVMSEKVYNE
ncbi:Prp9p [Sugiyamaella lignohabitans]|uniref:Prp9p n=1 Tax=Sugiyamaella lignohabitans TaxID=796027 RepID=A0A167D3V1_9ASCO|nr:Prp9p [Sugiyamaella lignohabitans]ANB12441.1 Prp9p [Sugiyamaella lignohabitans]